MAITATLEANTDLLGDAHHGQTGALNGTTTDGFQMGDITRLPVEISDEDLSIYLPQGGQGHEPDPVDGEVIDIVFKEIPIPEGYNVNDVSIFTPIDGDMIDPDVELDPIGGLEYLETTAQGVADNGYEPFDDFDPSNIIRLPVEVSDEDISIYLPQNGDAPGLDIDLKEGSQLETQTALAAGDNVDGAEFETTPLPEDGIFRTESGPLDVSGQDDGPIASGEMAEFETTPLPEDGIFRTESGPLDVSGQGTGAIGSDELEMVGTMPLSAVETGDLLI